MVEDEADDGMATAIARFVGDPRVEQIVICSVDKDLGQCVEGRARRPARPDAAGHLRRGRHPRQVRRRRRRAFPTTWRWSATRPMAIPACPAGAPRAPPPCSRSGSTSKRFRDSPLDWEVPLRGAVRPGRHAARPSVRGRALQAPGHPQRRRRRGRATSTAWRGRACRATSSWRYATSWASTPSARACIAGRDGD